MTEGTKIAFIINPIAGLKAHSDIEGVIRAEIDKKKWEPIILYTEYAGHGKELIREGVKSGIKYFIAIGGDGTVNEVFSEALNYDISVGIVPGGSGNGLARSLNIPMNIVKAIKGLNNFQAIKIDVGKVNNKYFFCTAGCGFDAWIGHKFSTAGKRGVFTYIKIILQELSRYKSENFTLMVDGEKITHNAFLLTVANANQYGNNAYISPTSQLNDGILELCIVKPFPLWLSPILAFRMLLKSIHKSRYMEVKEAKNIVFLESKEYTFHIDGEPVIINGNVEVSILPGKLSVLVPTS